jgi:hypothetical protein
MADTQVRFEQHFVVVDEASSDLDRLAEKTDDLTGANKRAIAIFKELEKEEKAAKDAAVADAKAKLSVVAATKEEADEQQKASRIIVKHLREQEAAQGKIDRAAKDATKATVKGAEESESALKKVGAAIAAAFAVSQIKSFVMESAQAFEDIHNLSLEMGVTAAQADTLRDAMHVAGVSSDALGAGMAKWSQAVKMSKDGTADLTGEMAAWGKVGKESLASFPEAMARVAREIEHAKSEQEKLVIASSYFGEAGRKLLPLLATGEASVRKASSGEGAFFDEGKVARAREFRAAMADAADRVEDMKNALALKLFPIIERLADRLLPAMETGADALASVMGFAADHATAIEVALYGAAASWGAMKAVNLADHFAKAAAAAAATSAAGGGGIGLVGKGVAMLGGGAGLAAVAGGLIVGELFDLLRNDLRGSGKGSGDLFGMREMKRQAEAGEHLHAITELRARDEEKQRDAIKALSKATGIAADQLAALGISTANTAGAMNAARGAAMNAGLDERMGKLGNEQFEVDVLKRATKFAGPLRDYARKHGGLAGAWEQLKDYAPERMVTVGSGAVPGISFQMHDAAAEQKLKLAAKLAYTMAYERELSDAKSALSKAFDRGQVTVNNNFNGPVTNRVELRNDDPDRVMFAITDTMAKMAAVRTTSRYTPIGTGAP